MTRKTRRDIERDLEDLDDTGVDNAPSVTIRHQHIMGRERAEREGREILGPADTPGETEHVRVEVDR